MTAFRRAASSFADLGPEACSRIAALAADVSLVVDSAGVVRDVAMASDALPAELAAGWLDRPLAELLPPDERHKLADLLAAVSGPAPARWRQLNLAGADGDAHPLQCITLPLHHDGRVLLLGRSLEATARLQQRLVQAQQAMEHDYWQFRDAETRYRHLFQASSEGVLVVDAETLRVLEANPAACRMLAANDTDPLVGRPLPECFAADADAVRMLLARVRVSGRPAELQTASAPDPAGLMLAASAFRQAGAAQLLVRLGQRQAERAIVRGADAGWIDMVRATPDALVLTDDDGRVLAANGAFLELAQLGAEEQLAGEPLDRWLDRSGVDLSVLLSNLRQRGVVRLYATRVRGELGSLVEVEIAAVQVSASPAMLGFTIRDVSRRLGATPRALQAMPKSVAQLTELVGRVPMKEIVGETAELIEQLCIEAALELTRGNRASAAEMLGMSRQSLYVKLRRYGLKDQDVENEK